MDYYEIYRPLSRTSFDSKMQFAFIHSMQTMSMQGQVDSNILRELFLPQEIETFVLNCVVTEEYNDLQMNEKQFYEVMNAIRTFENPKFEIKLKEDHLKWILPIIGSLQFELQEYIIFRLYRHHCLFTFSNEIVNIRELFIRKFSRSFDEFAAVVYFIHFLLAERKISDFYKIFEKIKRKFPWFIDNLSINRTQYITELGKFANTIDDYISCLRPSYSYPLIEYKGDIFLPTPHLLVHSITTAMMNRLTEKDIDLRRKIGKNACEEYLFQITIESGLFDEVYRESEYGGKIKKKTLDVLTRKGKVAILFDSKLFSPKTAVRIYDNEAYKADVNRIVEDMVKTYKQARYEFNHYECKFSVNVEQVYALVVVYQDGYLDMKEIYDRTAERLLSQNDSLDYNWLCSHIGLTGIDRLEGYLLTGTDIIPEFMNRRTSSDKWLTGGHGNKLVDAVIKYKDKLADDVRKLQFV